MPDLRERYARDIEELSATSRRTAELGFVSSQGGNISARIDDNVLAITPTKVPKSRVMPDDVVLIDGAGKVLSAQNGRRPTGETPLHVHLLAQRPDISGLVHAHPPVLTGFAIAGSEYMARPVLPEPTMEVGPMALLDYAEPLTDALAHTFDKALQRHNAFLMRNHGVLVMSHEGPARALELLEMLEAQGASIVTALQLGEVHELSRRDVEDLNNTMRTRDCPYPGAAGVVDDLADLYF